MTVGEFYQQLQALAGVAAIDGVSGERHSFADVVGVPGGDQRGGGVQHHDITARGALAVEHGTNDGGILLGVASGDFIERGCTSGQTLPA